MTRNEPQHRFSLVRGGLFFRLEKRLGIISDESLGIGKRILLFIGLTWVPILVLERLFSDFPYLASDIGVHIRFLFGGPLLILAEYPIERRLRLAIAEFEERGIVKDREQLKEALSAPYQQLCGPVGLWFEVLLAAALIFMGAFGYSPHYSSVVAHFRDIYSGHGTPPAFVWYSSLAIPWVLFLQLRWIWRFSAWVRVLRRVSKLPLNLTAVHSDSAGGLGFLSLAQESFSAVWVAVSAISASTIAFRIGSQGKSIDAYYLPICALVGLEALLLLAPLALFVPQLITTRLEGLLHYGKLSSHYAQRFEKKWMEIRGEEPKDLLGTADIQSLADLGNGFDRVAKMKIFPAEKLSVMRIFAAGAFPFLPLIFLVVPVDEVFRTMVKLVL